MITNPDLILFIAKWFLLFWIYLAVTAMAAWGLMHLIEKCNYSRRTTTALKGFVLVCMPITGWIAIGIHFHCNKSKKYE